MASQIFCDPCECDNKSSVAVRFCTDCEEHLCKECSEFHLRYKAFKGHTLIDLQSGESKIPSTQKYCLVHENVLLDFYCTNHDSLCCRKCIPEIHKACQHILPLEDASKDVKKSSLFMDTIQEHTDLTKVLQILSTNRANNLQSLRQKQVSIFKQLDDIKDRILKNVELLKSKLKNDLGTIINGSEHKIENESREIAQIETALVESKQELEFLNERGSNNQLFVALQQNSVKIKRSGDRIQEMLSTYKEIDVKFEELTPDIKSIGTIIEDSQPCSVQYKQTKLLQAQVQPEVKSLTAFQKEGQLDLKCDETYWLSDLVVTGDNRLFLCNGLGQGDTCVYIYRECKYYDSKMKLSSRPFGIALLPGTDKAVVTLPFKKSIQFINTSNMTTGDIVNVGFACYGITTDENNIIVGGSNQIHILKTNGEKLKQHTLQGLDRIVYLRYNKARNRIICKGYGRVKCLDLDCKLIYEYELSAEFGMAIDRLGNVYFGGYHTSDIHRLSKEGKFRDIVLSGADGVNKPYGMTFNNDFTKLYIINNSYTSVLIFGCK